MSRAIVTELHKTMDDEFKRAAKVVIDAMDEKVQWTEFVYRYKFEHGPVKTVMNQEMCRLRAARGSPDSKPQWDAWLVHWATRRLTR